MQLSDAVNGAFEGIGGIMNCINIWQLYKHKEVKGVHWAPTTLFTLWGYWNLFYYPHLGQWLSFFGGLGIVTSNTVWISMALYYARKIVVASSDALDDDVIAPGWTAHAHEQMKRGRFDNQGSDVHRG